MVRNCLPYLGWYLGGHEVQPPCCQSLRDKREVESTINRARLSAKCKTVQRNNGLGFPGEQTVQLNPSHEVV